MTETSPTQGHPDHKTPADVDTVWHGRQYQMEPIGPKGPALQHHHCRPPRGCRKTPAGQRSPWSGQAWNQTGATAADRLTVESHYRRTLLSLLVNIFSSLCFSMLLGYRQLLLPKTQCGTCYGSMAMWLTRANFHVYTYAVHRISVFRTFQSLQRDSYSVLKALI